MLGFSSGDEWQALKAGRTVLLAMALAILMTGIYSTLWVAIFDLGEVIHGERRLSRETVRFASGYHYDVEVTCAVPQTYQARPWVPQDWLDGRVVGALETFFFPITRISFLVRGIGEGPPTKHVWAGSGGE